MASTIQYHDVISSKKTQPQHILFIFYFINIKKEIEMTAACKEDNNLNYQEVNCVNISQIISLIDCISRKLTVRQYGSGLAISRQVGLAASKLNFSA